MKWVKLEKSIKKLLLWWRNFWDFSPEFLQRAGICEACFRHVSHFLILFVAFQAQAFAQIEPSVVSRIADAIYVAEGAERAVKPYGIISVKCFSESDCRRICENTIRNNFKRWESSGQEIPFLEFLAARYAPVSAHPLNKNWLPNVKRIIQSDLLKDGLLAEQNRRFFEQEFFEVVK